MSAIQNRFSPYANRVLAWTQKEVEKLQHGKIEPEHLLLGLIHDKQCAAHRILDSLKVDLFNLESELRASLQTLPQEKSERLEMSEGMKEVLELSLESVGVLQRPYLGTEHLLVGLLRSITTRAYPILRRAGVSYNQVLNQLKSIPYEGTPRNRQPTAAFQPVVSEPEETLSPIQIIARISPIFWGLAAATVLSGMAAYKNWLESGIAVFLFVTLGWIVSLSLHEFGHAIVAYYGGDRSVINRGYLTLNPLRYTHGFLSIILPLIYLAIGGIGLPGGAVYINIGRIPKKVTRSLVAAAGPIMTAMFTAVLTLPFVFGLFQNLFYTHRDFIAGWTVLVFIQLTSLVFNLLPIPGLDGFGILLPWLPPTVVRRIGAFGSLTIVLIFLLFAQNTPISRVFWNSIIRVITLLNMDFDLVILGLELYRFW